MSQMWSWIEDLGGSVAEGTNSVLASIGLHKEHPRGTRSRDASRRTSLVDSMFGGGGGLSEDAVLGSRESDKDSLEFEDHDSVGSRGLWELQWEAPRSEKGVKFMEEPTHTQKSSNVIPEHEMRARMLREQRATNAEELEREKDVPACVTVEFDADDEQDKALFEEQYKRLVMQREAERATIEQRLAARAMSQQNLLTKVKMVGKITKRKTRDQLGDIVHEQKAYMALETKFNSKMGDVHRDAAMVQHAFTHRPTNMDYMAHHWSKDPHFMRNNAEAAAHAARFLRGQMQLDTLDRKYDPEHDKKMRATATGSSVTVMRRH